MPTECNSRQGSRYHRGDFPDASRVARDRGRNAWAFAGCPVRLPYGQYSLEGARVVSEAGIQIAWSGTASSCRWPRSFVKGFCSIFLMPLHFRFYALISARAGPGGPWEKGTFPAGIARDCQTGAQCTVFDPVWIGSRLGGRAACRIGAVGRMQETGADQCLARGT